MQRNHTNFHFARQFREDTQDLSRARHRHYLFSHLNLKPKMHILEVNCGVGDASLELADYADVIVVGVDPDARKIEQARRMAIERNLSNRVTFIRSDCSCLHSLFQESSFDAIYSIESLKCSPSFISVYKDLCPLLRPGCRLAIYEWCWTQRMNANDVDHRRFADLLQTSTGISNRAISERTFDEAISALRACHTQVVHYEDLSESFNTSMVPWYTSLDNALSDTSTRWPNRSAEDGPFGNITKHAAEVLSKAGHLQLFTPMAFFVAKRKAVGE